MGNAQGWVPSDAAEAARGKTVIITGASSGLGLESARVLALMGAHVIMAVRNVAKTAPLVDAIKAETPSASIAVEVVELDDLESVRAFAKRILAAYDKLDVLMNNAGIMGACHCD